MIRYVVVLCGEDKPSFLKGYHSINEQLSYSLTLKHSMTFSSTTKILQFLLKVSENRPILEELEIHKVIVDSVSLGEKV